MKKLTYAFAILFCGFTFSLSAQSEIRPDLSIANMPDWWTLHNRKLTITDGVVHLDAQQGDGLLWQKDVIFSNGQIEFDVKGQNTPGRSFVGLAFHIEDEETFDAIYFRPFNFKNPDRNTHSVQYISMPEHDWRSLRENHPGTYENVVHPVPEPEDWFHVTVKINHPTVEVFVNDDPEPSLTIAQISDRKKGFFGFWVGNSSEGEFKNLTIMH